MAKQILQSQDYASQSRILNLLDAVDPQEPATLAQLQAQAEGNSWKTSVRFASTANVNIASPGATHDGGTAATNDRLLLKDQTAPEENGLYIYNGAATPLTRAEDADTFRKLENAVVGVEEGTANAGTTWRQTEINGTLGTDDVLWTSFGTAVPDASTTVKGKVELATQAEVNTGTDTVRVVTCETLAGYTGFTRKGAADVGNGSNTSYTVTHNFNTRDVVVLVRRTSGNYDEVECEVRINNVNSVDVLFASAPSSNQFRVIVIA